jgi:hypothetical protein
MVCQYMVWRCFDSHAGSHGGSYGGAHRGTHRSAHTGASTITGIHNSGADISSHDNAYKCIRHGIHLHRSPLR